MGPTGRPCAWLPGERQVKFAGGAKRDFHCWDQVQRSMKEANLGIVMTFSAGSRGSENSYQGKFFKGVHKLSKLYKDRNDVFLYIAARGSSCTQLPPSLAMWFDAGRAACIDGPNLGARESATVFQFCHEFYDSLPKATLFIQDDPEIQDLIDLGVGNASWVEKLEEAYEARSALSVDLRKDDVLNKEDEGLLPPWELQPCPCFVDRERNFAPETYGVYRSMHWWTRTFLKRYTSEGHKLAHNVSWPRHAQFSVPRAAIRMRSRNFYRLNMALVSVPSPLKHMFPTSPGEDKERAKKFAKWANFGPRVVDLGPLPPPKVHYPDKRAFADGMTLALMYERLWFRIFDPLLAEADVAFSDCYEEEALKHGPVRCHDITCPHIPTRKRAEIRRISRLQDGGCILTDHRVNANWQVEKNNETRCLQRGCIVEYSSNLALGQILWNERNNNT